MENVEQVVADAARQWLEECLGDFGSREILAYGNGEIRAKLRENHSIVDSLVLDVFADHNKRQLYLTNISLPVQVRRKGIGKRLIRAILLIAEKCEYTLYVTGLVETFYDQLVARGAEVVVSGDVVRITNQTDLTHHYD